jgi:hypothetical protein
MADVDERGKRVATLYEMTRNGYVRQVIAIAGVAGLHNVVSEVRLRALTGDGRLVGLRGDPRLRTRCRNLTN